ncbi:MAG: hypothetical protein ACI8WB_004697 [Phenylobacterium sp.]|jgi:hypothetical protein
MSGHCASLCENLRRMVLSVPGCRYSETHHLRMKTAGYHRLQPNFDGFRLRLYHILRCMILITQAGVRTLLGSSNLLSKFRHTIQQAQTGQYSFNRSKIKFFIDGRDGIALSMIILMIADTEK